MHPELSCTATKSFVQRTRHLIFFVNNSGGAAVGERTYQMLASIIRLFRAWRRYRDAVQELSYLSDRDLADIGVNRSEIQRLAWQHAHSA